MKEQKIHKICEAALIIIILVSSVIIYIERDKIQELGNLGYGGVFLLCFLSNFAVFLPAPSLAVVMSFSQVLSPVLVATVGAVGTTLGEGTGYILGKTGGDLSPKFAAIVDWLAKRIRNTNSFVFILALLPLPLFDFAGVYAGGKGMSRRSFLLSCFLGKWLKMLFYALAMGNMMEYVLKML